MQQLCEELKESIRAEIEKSNIGKSRHNIDQLRQFLNELKTMSTTEDALITYPRFIIDSWAQNDILDTELLELADLYNRK